MTTRILTDILPDYVLTVTKDAAILHILHTDITSESLICLSLLSQAKPRFRQLIPFLSTQSVQHYATHRPVLDSAYAELLRITDFDYLVADLPDDTTRAYYSNPIVSPFPQQTQFVDPATLPGAPAGFRIQDYFPGLEFPPPQQRLEPPSRCSLNSLALSVRPRMSMEQWLNYGKSLRRPEHKRYPYRMEKIQNEVLVIGPGDLHELPVFQQIGLFMDCEHPTGSLPVYGIAIVDDDVELRLVEDAEYRIYYPVEYFKFMHHLYELLWLCANAQDVKSVSKPLYGIASQLTFVSNCIVAQSSFVANQKLRLPGVGSRDRKATTKVKFRFQRLGTCWTIDELE